MNQGRKHYLEWLTFFASVIGLLVTQLITYSQLKKDVQIFSLNRFDVQLDRQREYIVRFAHEIPNYCAARKKLIMAGLREASARANIASGIHLIGVDFPFVEKSYIDRLEEYFDAECKMEAIIDEGMVYFQGKKVEEKFFELQNVMYVKDFGYFALDEKKFKKWKELGVNKNLLINDKEMLDRVVKTFNFEDHKKEESEFRQKAYYLFGYLSEILASREKYLENHGTGDMPLIPK